MVEKKSFLVYCDSLGCIDFMTNNQKGELFTALLKYASGEDVEEFSSGAVRASFNFMSSQINRDAGKYEERCEINRRNGLKGGRPKADAEDVSDEKGETGDDIGDADECVVNNNEYNCSQNNRKETEITEKNQSVILKPDTDKDNDTDTEKEKDITSSYSVKQNDVESYREIVLPLDDGEYVVDRKKYKYYCSLYPSLNIYLCLQDMKCWLEVNKDKRRSASMMDRFICGWLSRNLSTKVSNSGSTSASALFDRSSLLKQLEEMNM